LTANQNLDISVEILVDLSQCCDVGSLKPLVLILLILLVNFDLLVGCCNFTLYCHIWVRAQCL